MEKIYTYIIVSACLAAVVIVKRMFTHSSYWDAIFIGGLDIRPNDYDIEKQLELFKNGSDKKVKAFRYNTDIKIIKQFLKDNPKTPVYMFSASCNMAEEISKDSNANLKKIYIIEPYGESYKTQNIVKKAVAKGVPAKNVIHGCSLATGRGIIEGSTFSGDCTHWGALISKGLNPKNK